MTPAAQLNRITAFRLSSRHPERLARFYVEAIGFRPTATTSIANQEIVLLGLSGSGRRQSLFLGDQRIDLDGFDPPGRPYPEDCNAADLLFQHFAIAVTDAEAAYRRVRDHGAGEITHAGPVTLPKSAGGVIAVKFRDPEGHPLEFLQFPNGSGPAWIKAGQKGVGALGVDHSAISITDTDASIDFYERCGLALGKRTLNRGVTQAALDGLRAPTVDVAPLLPPNGAPHLELLGYRSPRGRPAGVSKPNDVAATRVVWASDRDGVLFDPDGHMHQLQNQP